MKFERLSAMLAKIIVEWHWDSFLLTHSWDEENGEGSQTGDAVRRASEEHFFKESASLAAHHYQRKETVPRPVQYESGRRAIRNVELHEFRSALH